MRTLLVATILATAGFATIALPTASACIQPCAPPVYVCVDDVNRADCPGGHDVCVGVLSSPYHCEDVPELTCGSVCWITNEVSVCNQRDGCWGGHDHCIEVGGRLVEPTPFCWDDLE